MAAITAAAVDENFSIFFRNHFGCGVFINASYRQKDSAGDMTAVVLSHIQNDNFFVP